MSAAPIAPTNVPDEMQTPVEHASDTAAPENHVDVRPKKTPLISINTDILDASWSSAMDLADPEILRPTGIVLPFLESYPIDNFEVKLNLLNLRF